MAMAGSKSSSSRGRPYGLMLLLAFGAAVLGMVMLHKLRERRLFSLLIQDKDRELLARQLLLQKERDTSREMKRKIEEMKAKAVALRTQKMKLANKLAEMKSVTASLMEEQKTTESELQEEKNKIKTLTEKVMYAQNENRRMTAITELLKQKEAAIQELKNRLENQAKVWSVSSDDPSNAHVNITATENVLSKVKDAAGEIKGGLEDQQSGKSINSQDEEEQDEGGKNTTEDDMQDGDHLKRRHGENKIALEDEHEEGIPREGQLEKLEDFQDYGRLGRRGRGDNRDTEEGEEREGISKDAQADMVESSRNGIGLKMNDTSGDSELMVGEKQELSSDEQKKKIQSSEDDESKEKSIYFNDGKKLEMLQHIQTNESSTMRSDHHHRSNASIKRWRAISDEGESDDDLKYREHVNLGTKGEGENISIESEMKRVLNLTEGKDKMETNQDSADSRMRDENGTKMAFDGSDTRDEHTTAFDADQSKMPKNSKDYESSEGDKQAEHSVEDHLEILENSNDKVLERRPWFGGKNVAEGASANGQLELPKKSEIGKSLGAVPDNGITRREETMEVSKNENSEIAQISKLGARVKDKNVEDSEAKSVILRYERMRETDSSQESKGFRSRGEISGRKIADIASVIKEPKHLIPENLIEAVDSSAVTDAPENMKRIYKQKKIRSSTIEKMKLVTN